jgi:aminoglycoside 6'-N-acetyltransferase
MTRYRFRPVEIADLPLLARWLATPHVAAWQGDPATELKEIESCIGDARMHALIVLCDERPIGYQQSYAPHDWDGHPYADQPRGTRGVDQFIGEADMLGRGHGSAFVRAFVEWLFDQGAPRVVTDPDPDNGRAIRAYAKAGFRPLGQRATPWGEVLLMVRDRDAAAAA